MTQLTQRVTLMATFLAGLAAAATVHATLIVPAILHAANGDARELLATHESQITPRLDRIERQIDRLLAK